MNISKVAATDLLPIRWETVTELNSGRRAICARLVWLGHEYKTAHVVPHGYARALIELTVLMIRTEIEQAVNANGNVAPTSTMH